MTMTTGQRAAREAEQLADLVAGREPPEVVARLRALGEQLRLGRLPDAAGLALLARMRTDYGHELHALGRPEPW